MSQSSKPTAAQISWLAGIFGPDVWRELSIKSDFMNALDTSIEKARRIALRHLAAKERGFRSPGPEAVFSYPAGGAVGEFKM